jgi:CheY-like chemotaxis protein
MDIQMPVMDGLEAIKIIREKWLNGPKIIVITAFDDYHDTCLDAGADDFLNKPLRIEKLKVAIEYNMPVSTYVSNSLDEFTATRPATAF